MSDRVPTRAEIIERIRASSKDAFILEEMQRLGFWPAGQGEPAIEAALIQREVELMRALDQVQQDLRAHSDPEAALKRMREDQRTSALCVVVFTSSGEERDIARAYQLRANSFVRKPVAFESFSETVKTVGHYWLHCNRPMSAAT